MVRFEETELFLLCIAHLGKKHYNNNNNNNKNNNNQFLNINIINDS